MAAATVGRIYADVGRIYADVAPSAMAAATVGRIYAPPPPWRPPPSDGSTRPEPLKGIELEVSIAGQRHVWSFDCAPDSGPPDPKCQTDSSFVFEWDGLDAYGRRMQAEQAFQVRLGWSYQGVYSGGRSDFEVSFARFGDAPLSANPTRQRVTVWREWQGALGILDAAAMGLAGWSVSQHHVYSPASGTVFFGDGRRKTRAALEPIVSSVGGGGFACAYYADEPASEAAMDEIKGLAVAPDGTIYYAQQGACGSVVRRLTTAGMVVHVAGSGGANYNGDGIPATTAKLAYPTDVALGVDGSIYIADSGNSRVRRVGADGIITTVAGSGTGTFSGDGGLAVDAKLGNQIAAIAIGRDGSLYIADSNNNRVRRVAPDGVIDTVVGGGSANSVSAPLPVLATDVSLALPQGLALDGEGNLFVATGAGVPNVSDATAHRVLRVAPDGTIHELAGSGAINGPESDGLLATAQAMSPGHLATDGAGRVYAVDKVGSGRGVRRIGTDGIIHRFLGRLDSCTELCGEGGPARAAWHWTAGVAVGPTGDLYAASGWDPISRVRSPLPGAGLAKYVLPSDDGREIYIFNADGRHLNTRDAVLDRDIFVFDHENGLLTTITDAHGNETTVNRDIDGKPLGITGPFDQQTTFTLDANDHLWKVTNPNAETWEITYQAGGLVDKFTNPRGKSSNYTYDAKGRITEVIHDGESDPRTWTRTVDEAGHTVVERETPLGPSAAPVQ